jgi:probable rRNA maturation factor
VSAIVGVAADGVRLPMPRARIAEVATAVLRAGRARRAMLSITFVSRRRIRALNRAHLRRDHPTDVIAFGFRSAGRGSALVGDVYIAPEVARESARANDIPVREELVRLIVHGTLHVLGHDHPDGSRRTRSAMWRTQERLVRRLTARAS